MKLRIILWINEGDKRSVIKSLIRMYLADLVCL